MYLDDAYCTSGQWKLFGRVRMSTLWAISVGCGHHYGRQPQGNGEQHLSPYSHTRLGQIRPREDEWLPRRVS